MVSLLGCAIGFCIVHLCAYNAAISDKAVHPTHQQAVWQAIFYDFLIGFPVAALCGWLVASFIKSRQPQEPYKSVFDDDDTEELVETQS